MQWVIDLIKEWVLSLGYATELWVESRGYLTDSFVDRGASDGWDWTLGDFTLDGSWHMLNVSAIVPSGARTVLYRVQIKNDLVNKKIFLRTLGHTTNVTCWHIVTDVGHVAKYDDAIVAIPAIRYMDYYGHAGGWTVFNLKVAGWWI